MRSGMARVTLDGLAVLIACFRPSPQFYIAEREVVMKFGVGRLMLHGSEVMSEGLRVLSLACPKNSTVVSQPRLCSLEPRCSGGLISIAR